MHLGEQKKFLFSWIVYLTLEDLFGFFF